MDNTIIKASPEIRYRAELEQLAQHDDKPRPEGWRLSPQAVRRFILGDETAAIGRKFYGNDALVERAIVTLMGNQGLMLVGEPGTAKTFLSELLAAAISGDSGLTVQGTAGTTEDQIKYTWNYALLLAEGPSERALVPAPVYQGMTQGKLVRFEEITRCPPEVQDGIISIMSDKQLLIPEWGDEGRLFARRGFNLIATANLRDRGVNEMSAALKRRFNFETVLPIADPEFETTLVMQEVNQQLAQTATRVELSADVVRMLVTAFQDLRQGQTGDGVQVKSPDTVMSTAEAVNLVMSAALRSAYLGDGKLSAEDVASQLWGVAVKDSAEDRRKLKHYLDTVGRERARKDKHWKALVKIAGQAE
ncbi:MAG: AAA family ATPase [Candidatus Thiodiazotropha sp.]